jgi:ABC-type sugar transport system ATPase subunit
VTAAASQELLTRRFQIEVRGLDKRYGAVHALKAVDFEIREGEVVGLIGANGAGKSTLVKVLSGQVVPDEGAVQFRGEEVSLGNPREARRLGVAVVPQELALVEDQSVSENMYLGRVPNTFGLVNSRKRDKLTAEWLGAVGLHDSIDPRMMAGDLTTVEQRLVGIAAAISTEPRVLIMDEPSAALPPDAAELLEPIIRRITKSGTSVIYVSHRLGEVQRFSDRVVAMRDGRVVGTLTGAEREIGRMVELVGGRALAEEPELEMQAGLERPRIAEARGLSGARVKDVDLELHEGEILGVGGLFGSGRSELLRLLGGSQRHTGGELEIFGGPAPRSPRAAVKRGVGYLPEGRGAMVLPTMTVAENMTIAALGEVTWFGDSILSYGKEQEIAGEMAKRVNLVGSLGAPILALSGGNQQKAFIGRWMLRRPRLLILDEPTIGIDVHARAEIHRLIRGLAKSGTSVVVACAEPEELVLLCHRVVVMVEGRISREFTAPLVANDVVSASYAH